MSGPGSRNGAIINGKWHVDRLLGSGGMAEVYAATHRNGKRAALKILHRELAGKPVTLRRFRREGYAANRVGHPAVVIVDDDDVCEDGAPYLVMELLLGQTLEELRNARGGKLSLAEVAPLAVELMAVMAAAHQKGVVHRDIKPSNLFVTLQGALKVLDFGIARVSDARDHGDATAECFLGTPAYMSPEQARGRWERVDARSDIYSIGATLFTLLTGRPVHEAATRNEQLGLAMAVQAPALRGRVPEVSDDLAAVVDRSLRYDSEQRWPSAEAMRRAWRDASQGSEHQFAPDASLAEHSSARAPGGETPQGEPAAATLVGERAGPAGEQPRSLRSRSMRWLLAGTLSACGVAAAVHWVGLRSREAATDVLKAGLGLPRAQPVRVTISSGAPERTAGPARTAAPARSGTRPAKRASRNSSATIGAKPSRNLQPGADQLAAELDRRR